MIKNFHHLAISVADMERSIEFYKAVLGLDQMGQPFPIGGEQYDKILELKGVEGRMCVMSKDGFYMEIFEFKSPTPAEQDINYPVCDRGITHFGVEVEDIENTYKRMEAAGVRFHSPIEQFPGGMKAAYGRDPDGNVIEILERVAQ